MDRFVRGCVFRFVLVTNAIQMRVGSQVERMLSERRCGYQGTFEPILRQSLKLPATLGDNGCAILPKEINTSLRYHRRGKTMSAETLLPLDIATARISTSGHAVVGNPENFVARKRGR